MFPSLTPQEVERFVSLGKVGSARLREGDGAGAEAAFRQQLAIFPLNPEPHVSLALVAARGGAKKQALACLRAAVLRGFTDVSRVERSEVWLELRRDPAFLALVDAVPALMDADERWVGWDAFGASHPPPDLESVARQWDRRKRAIEAMAPALGPRLDRLWRRVIDRSTAALLQAYVVAPLREQWEREVGAMRGRILGLRAQVVAQLRTHCPTRDFSFIARQRGMFSFLGITTAQVRAMREEHHVYMTDDSRINIAGLRQENLEYFARATAAVLAA